MLRPVVIAPEPATGVGQLLLTLEHALAGSGPAVAFDPALEGVKVPGGAALVLATSGSTGTPRHVILEQSAVTASADATHKRLGGPGQWLLTLPATHVAGVQVLVRSLLAGTTPVHAGPGSFRPEKFTADAARLDPAARRYVSLVPTQLHRLLTASGVAGDLARDALRSFDAVLVGGAALNPHLAHLARTEQVPVRTTYGMTETCGGCVYDSAPLDGVHVTTDDDGRILIRGPVLFHSYLNDPGTTAATLITRNSHTWLRTNDLGTVQTTGAGTASVQIAGRADDVIITGGLNVAAQQVEAALAGWNGIAEVCVVGVPDPEWGQLVAAAITLSPGATAPGEEEIREHVARIVSPNAAPRHIRVLSAMPARGPGKHDRAHVKKLLAHPAAD